MHLNHLPGPSCSGALSQVCCVALDVNCSGAQEDLVSNWEPAHSLVEDAGLWGQDWSNPLPSSSGCHMLASLPPAGWPVHSRGGGSELLGYFSAGSCG